MSIQQEIETALVNIQKMLDGGASLNDQDLEMLLLASLIEDEA